MPRTLLTLPPPVVPMSLAVVLAALAAVVIWGASPVATKLAVGGMSAITVALLRTILGGAAALPLALTQPRPKGGAQWSLIGLSAFCGFIGFPLVFSLGVASTSANHAGLILGILPILTGAIAKAWDGERPRALWWVGSAIALAGAVLLVTGRETSGGPAASLEGDLLVLASTLFAATGYVAGGRLKQTGYPSTGTTFWGAVLAGLVLLPSLFWLVPGEDWARVPAEAWAGLVYLAIGVTLAGYVLWYWALGQGGIARMGLLQFLQPISGVVLAHFILGEPVTWTLVAAGALILTGVWIGLEADKG